MDKHIKIENESDIVRDRESHAIINVNKKAYMEAKAAREKRLQQSDRLEKVENDLKEVKAFLEKILQKLDKE